MPKPKLTMTARVANVVMAAARERGIRTQRNLSRTLDVSEKWVSDRFNGKVEWRLSDLRLLNAILRLNDDEWLKLKECMR